MIKNTLEKIQAQIQSGTVPDEQREELLRLVQTLKGEIQELSENDPEQARSIAGFTDVSTYEATRADKRPELVKLSVQALSSSVEGFEKSHPRLVEIVNSLCVTLSNLGI